MDRYQPFGKWLRQKRKSLDLTQDSLAERVGCSPAAIRMIEQGKRRPSRQVANLLASVLAVPETERPEFLAAARQAVRENDNPAVSLPDAGPQPPALDPVSLPAQLTALIGRGEEVETLLSLLLSNVRLLTLTGPPGIGKTRLTVEVATLLSGAVSSPRGPRSPAERFPDGIFWVPLADITSPAMVVPAIARTLHVEGVGTQPLGETLKGYLRHKRLLLLLDNFEHVIETAPTVGELLAACPQLSVLITSREALNLRGEREFEVSPLPLPSEDHPRPEDLAHNASVALFVERAQAVDRHFVLSPGNAHTVAAICGQLDGLPLAIELVAARTKTLPIGLLLDRLRKTQGEPHLSLASGGARDFPGRHRTLRDAIGWSYDLLNSDEQLLFRRLGVFLGGFTLPAAEAICNADSLTSLAVLDGVSQLRQKNLLTREVGDEPDGEASAEEVESEARFTMLETIREYALERLRESGEEPALRLFHAEYFLGIASSIDLYVVNRPTHRIYRHLGSNDANLGAALNYTIESGRADMAVQFGISLGRYWELRSSYSEGRAWITRILAAQEAHAARTTVGQLDSEGRHKRAMLLLWAGRLSIYMSDYSTARTLLQESLRIATDLRQERDAQRANQHLGMAAWLNGDYSVAHAHFRQWESYERSVGNKNGIANAMWVLGNTMGECGDFEQAEGYLSRAIAMGKELGDVYVVIGSTRDLGITLCYEGKYKEAIPLLEQALSSARQSRFEVGVSWTLTALGMAWLGLGEYDRAEHHFRESIVLARRTDKHRIPDCLEGLAEVELAQSGGQKTRGARLHLERAATLLGAADGARRLLDTSIIPARAQSRARLAAEIETRLGSPAYTHAYANGQQMGLEESISLIVDVSRDPGQASDQ